MVTLIDTELLLVGDCVILTEPEELVEIYVDVLALPDWDAKLDSDTYELGDTSCELLTVEVINGDFEWYVEDVTVGLIDATNVLDILGDDDSDIILDIDTLGIGVFVIVPLILILIVELELSENSEVIVFCTDEETVLE